MSIPFYEAKSWKRGIPPRTQVKWIVLHCMQAPEKPTAAVDCAKWLAGLNPKYPSPKLVSCHYFVDNTSIAQGVREDCIAFHAPGANRLGIGIEHAGFSSQTPAQWLDDYGKAMLARSAQLTAQVAKRWSIPVQYVSPTNLRAGTPGFTRHLDVTNAWPDISHGHGDPGPSFPLDYYLELVRLELAKLQSPAVG